MPFIPIDMQNRSIAKIHLRPVFIRPPSPFASRHSKPGLVSLHPFLVHEGVMIVLVCGGRDYGDISDRSHPLWPQRESEYLNIQKTLNKLSLDWPKTPPDQYGNWLPRVKIITGGARGADTAAIDWAVIHWCDFQEHKAGKRTVRRQAPSEISPCWITMRWIWSSPSQAEKERPIWSGEPGRRGLGSSIPRSPRHTQSSPRLSSSQRTSLILGKGSPSLDLALTCRSTVMPVANQGIHRPTVRTPINHETI